MVTVVVEGRFWSGARILKIAWCESRRIYNSHVGNYSIQVGKSRRWITLCLWESQWIEQSRRLVPVGILLLLIQLHGYFSSVNLLACVNCYDQWGGRAHQEFRHSQTGRLPSPIGHANVICRGISQPVFLTLVGNPFRDGWVAIMANVKFINLLD